MKAQSSPIVKATTLFYSKKYSQVIRLLEPEIFSFRENFQFYYLLGLSSLYSGNYGGAESYLKRAVQIEEENLEILLALAFIYFKKGKTDEALEIWLEVLDLYPKNKTAKMGLDFLRKGRDPKLYLKASMINKLLPVIRAPFSFKKLAFILVLLLLIAGSPPIYLTLRPYFQKKPSRPGLEQYNLPGKEPALVEFGSEALWILSEKEIRLGFEKAKAYFNDYRDNLALVEINRLLNSNASKDVKQIMRVMADQVQQPDFSNIKDSFSLAIVKQNPQLYNGCFVLWQGKVGSLDIQESRIHFDFWVGSQTEFQGVVPATLNFASKLENGMAIEILGKVITSEDPIRLQGLAIHKLLLKE